MAKHMAAGELMVIEVVVAAEVDAGEQVLGVGQGVDGHPAPADLPLGLGVVGVPAHQGGQVVGHREPVSPGARSSRKRAFVSSAVPKPANIRMVHNFERYIDAWGPRV